MPTALLTFNTVSPLTQAIEVHILLIDNLVETLFL